MYTIRKFLDTAGQPSLLLLSAARHRCCKSADPAIYLKERAGTEEVSPAGTCQLPDTVVTSQLILLYLEGRAGTE